MFNTTSGDFIRAFGAMGASEGNLSGVCSGLRFLPDGGHILVSERGQSRLSLFTLNGEFVRCIPLRARGNPSDIELTCDGHILVSDFGKPRIDVFSLDAILLRTFDRGTSLSRPRALAIYGSQLFVLDGSKHITLVHVFN